MFLRIFGGSIIVTILALITATIYGGTSALFLCIILGILEISLSFDNAVVNAKILERMTDFWQKIFLTVGIVIAVFGMRILFPLLVVGISANLNPVEAIKLALEKGPIDEPGSYAYLLAEAHPQIAAFGGMFLMMLFLDWVFEDRDIKWLNWLEKPLAKIGKLDQLSVIVGAVLLIVAVEVWAEKPATVLLSGMLGLITYLAVNGLGSIFEGSQEDEEDEGDDELPAASGAGTVTAKPKQTQLVKVAGKAAFFLFLYLEVLDASFSFDGVIGAFAITSDPIIIALGLGLIGAMFVRSLTVFLVRKGTLAEYVFLEHGAHWAIGALATILLVSIGVHLNEIVTGLVGVAFIGAAFLSSVVRNRRILARGGEIGHVHA
ncbi:DUF475 domain-containing protein [Nakamurella silvestris]|nr:DUF475 domain-containing protein [Nakamurella silvestris]